MIKNNRFSDSQFQVGVLVYSRLSLLSAIITLFGIGGLMNLTSETIQVQDSIQERPFFIFKILPIVSIIGLLMTILSFVKKEPSRWIKWLGAIFNVIFFLSIFIAIVFYYFIEFSKN